MKKLLLYVKNSDIHVSFYLNPLRWNIDFWWDTQSDMDPGLIVTTSLTFGPIQINLFIDDGSW
ncbi:hypothetical protein UFOVP247_176 [uncultured Caudovirales phage]|uniref:Uncharacterized protein n=1 Tax=uncultured Caudovirales phage TaxID=2100421 RepID=A0A6J7WXN2_9CAUD|nr:hypothetical protein UFOVP247_176 [uncultured Caudovirales phage]